MSPITLLTLFALLFSPPSGRPPGGPLERGDGRQYEFSINVNIGTVTQLGTSNQPTLRIADTPIVMPVIFQNTFSRVDPESLSAKLWYGSREDRTLNQRTRTDSGFPFGTQLAVLPVPSFTGQSLRWELGYRVQSWSSRIDEAKAAAITWPREWPREVQDGLKPQMYIESDHVMFKETVEKVSGGNLRMVPPYLAAKDLVRYCINSVQTVGDGVDRRDFGLLHGLEVEGAVSAAVNRRGSPNDLVCVCVAVLRAAGIPARPVIGVTEGDRGQTTFVSWAEFYLPGAEWIPFDPDELRGNGSRNRDVRQPWADFGTMKDLNRRVPLAFHFVPPAGVVSPEAPSVWGWAPKPEVLPPHEQVIVLSLTNKGTIRSAPRR